MNKIHTSYKFSKALKEFLGEGAVEPIIPAYYYEDKKGFGISATREYSGSPAAYQLHDLLSKPFCHAMILKRPQSKELPGALYGWANGLSSELRGHYFYGGMEAVEKALTEMMEGE